MLEDVTYLGGYPGQAKRRKRCTATLTIQAVEVAGPNGLAFRVPWEVVRTIEAQNADEARFRMNTKVHRDATARYGSAEEVCQALEQLYAQDGPAPQLAPGDNPYRGLRSFEAGDSALFFGRSAEGEVVHAWQTEAGGPWSPWRSSARTSASHAAGWECPPSASASPPSASASPPSAPVPPRRPALRSRC